MDSKVHPPYRHPDVPNVVNAHDRSVNVSPGAFDVPPGKSFLNTVVVVIDSLSRAQIMAYMPRVRQLLLELHRNPMHGKTLYSFVNVLSLAGTTDQAFSALLSGMDKKAKGHRTWLQDEVKKKGFAFRYFGRTFPVSTAFQNAFPKAFSSMVPGGVVKRALFHAPGRGFCKGARNEF